MRVYPLSYGNKEIQRIGIKEGVKVYKSYVNKRYIFRHREVQRENLG